ncbi:MAG: nickel pincer cofactor biosynthesis protein LarC [Deltaproteobacteria bacterium]|nr:nickel pincer cofactor biosynthesis protein LarC [Deltaproteobacteria bacterium]
MTRHLHVDPVSGVAGDMLLGAVLDLGVTVDSLLGPLRTLDVPTFSIEAKRDRRLGLAGTHATVLVEGEDAGSAWMASPRPPHEEHAHAHLPDLLATIDGATGLPPHVRAQARSAYLALAHAEAKAHGCAPEEVHLHEVGAADALIDLCGGLLGLHLLGVESVSCGPLPLGSGTVRCAHGVMPVPVPAVTALVEGLPTVPGAGQHPTGELCTPTGVALLRAVVTSFGPPPAMRLDAVGLGLGTRERPDVPNVVRLLLGDVTGDAQPESQDVLVLTTVLDDLDGRVLPRVTERLLEAGALDVLVLPGHGKKGRPALRLEVLVPDDAAREQVSSVIFRETPTLGLRWRREHRTTLMRRHCTVETPFGAVSIKEGLLEGEVVTRQPELDDCLRLAREEGVPLREVLAAAVAAAREANPE